MRRQKCNQCGTMLDVSNLEKGSKFACSNCGTILVAGETAVVKRSLKGSGPAFQRTAKADDDAPPAPTRTRRTRATAAPRDEDGGGRSKRPLFLGIGVLVVVGVVLAATMGGGGGRAGTTTGGGGGSGLGDWWADKTTKLSLADADTIRGWMKEASEKGYDQEAGWDVKEHDLFTTLLRKDPDDPDANRYAGRKDLRATEGFSAKWDAMNADYTALPDEIKAFADRYAPQVDGGKGVWLADAAHAEATALLAAFAKWHEERTANPAAKAIEKGIRDARMFLKDHDFVPVVGGPFVLLMGYSTKEVGGDEKRVQLEEKGAKFAKALDLVAKEFDTRFREPLGLHPVERGRYFVQVGLAKQTDFQKFVQGEGFDVTGDVLGFFSPRSRWAGVVTSRDDQGSKDIGGDLGHEAVHQLQHYYSKDPKKKYDPNYFSDWTGIWLTEGLAEYVGGGVTYEPATGDTTFTGFARRRVEFLQGMRDNGVPLIRLREVVQLRSLEAWQRYVIDTWIPTMREDEDMPEAAARWLGEQPGVVAKVMYAHSWYLSWFLNEYENGKYAAGYRDLLMTALRGKRKPETYRTRKGVEEQWAKAFDAFRDIYGIQDSAAWDAMHKEWEKQLPKTLRKAK